MKYLTEKHLIRISAITKLPLEKLVELDSMGLLSHSGIISLAIRRDWKRLVHKECYSNDQIIQALMNEYNVKRSFVVSAVKTKRKLPHYCRECGEEIGATEFTRNNGLCNHCVIKNIKIDEEPQN